MWVWVTKWQTPQQIIIIIWFAKDSLGFHQKARGLHKGASQIYTNTDLKTKDKQNIQNKYTKTVQIKTQQQ